MNKKIKFTFSLMIFILIYILLSIISCPATGSENSDGGSSSSLSSNGINSSNSGGEASSSNAASWTIMVYMDADNNLEEAAIEDFNEMESVDLSGTNIRLIVLMDRVNGYDTSNGDWKNTRLYEVNYDSGGMNMNIISTRLESAELGLTINGDEELNMGDPDTLSKFISYCETNHPADNYFLILWNHGGGWRNNTIAKNIARAICWDDSNNSDCLYMSELSGSVSGRHLNVIGFDACLMGMIEVAYELKDHADYMIGSEESEPTDGWEYNNWLGAFKSSDKTDASLCNSVVTAFETMYDSTSGTTLSTIDLSKVDAIFTELNNFSLSLYNTLTTSAVRDDLLNYLLGNVEKYWMQNGDDYNLDLWHLADRIQEKYNYCDDICINLKSAINNAISYEWHNSSGHPDSHGISIHFTGTNSSGGYEISYAYCNGYPVYPVAFVQNVDNAWVPHYDSFSGSITGPGFLYRLWLEELP